MIRKIAEWLGGWIPSKSATTAVSIEKAIPKKPNQNQQARSPNEYLQGNWVEGDYRKAKELLSDLNCRYDWLKKFRPSMSDSGLRAIKKGGVYMTRFDLRERSTIEKIQGGKGRHLPTFMSLALGDRDADIDVVGESEFIMYAEKHRWKAGKFNVQRPSSGDIFYEFGYVFKLGRRYIPHSACVEILHDGSVLVLRSMQSRTITLPNGDSFASRYWGKSHIMPSKKMEADGDLSEAARDRHTAEMFTYLYNMHIRCLASTQVHALRGGVRMIFTVPAHSWKDFFSDRVTAKAADGKRKRIFHHVAAHVRSNGQRVPMHTRGMTRFSWNGFDIKICEIKPGRVHFADFDLVGTVMTDAEANAIPGEWAEADECVDRLQDVFTKDLHRPSRAA